jgi:site-specific recombinase XerD
LEALRTYWRRYRPDDWLFAGRAGTPLSPTGLQKAFTDAKRRAGVTTLGGIHGLRHNSAFLIMPGRRFQPQRLF